MRYKDTLKASMKDFTITTESYEQTAQNRAEWCRSSEKTQLSMTQQEYLEHQIEFSACLPISTKLILLVIFSLYEIKHLDPWVSIKRDQHALRRTGCNGHHVTLSLSMTSQSITKRRRNRNG